jgi:hypothetical protein
MKLFIFIIYINMKTFQDHLFSKQLDRLAEKCIRDNIPIVEFTNWYISEGQYLFEYDTPLNYQPSFWGSVGSGAASGAGVGAGLGTLAGGQTGIGAGIGAAAGGVMGAGKYFYDKLKQKRMRNGNFDQTKAQAADALNRLAAINPDSKGEIAKLVGELGKLGGGTGGSAPAATPVNTPTATAGTPTSGDTNLDAELQNYGVNPNFFAGHGMTKTDWDNALAKHQPEYSAGNISQTDMVSKTLNDLGITTDKGKPLKFNPANKQFEHRKR